MTYRNVRFDDIAARVMMAALFLFSGVGKLMAPAMAAQYAAKAGLPFPVLSIWAAIIVEILMPILLIAGYRIRLVCAVLGVFTIATALFFHPFWAVGSAESNGQTIQFLKNIAIAGGLWFCARAAGSNNSPSV